VADLRAGLDELERRAAGQKLGAVGFCFGGGMVWLLLASGEPRLAAAVPFYGPLPDGAGFSGSKAAVLGIYAEQDARVNASRETAAAALEQAGLTHEIVTIPTPGHPDFIAESAGTLRSIAEKLTPAIVAMGSASELGTRSPGFRPYGPDDAGFIGAVLPVLGRLRAVPRAVSSVSRPRRPRGPCTSRSSGRRGGAAWAGCSGDTWRRSARAAWSWPPGGAVSSTSTSSSSERALRSCVFLSPCLGPRDGPHTQMLGRPTASRTG
jgi:Dienelactone hydrolase family